MKNTKNINHNETFLKVIPITLILLIVPIIVFMKSVAIKGIVTQFYSSSTQYDFFNYYKSAWLIGLTISSIIFIAIFCYVKKIKFNLIYGFIPLFVYYLFVFLSTSFSKYHDIALNGFIDRYEGFWVISCYVIICFLTAHFITYEKDVKVLLGSLIVCATLLCLLGLTQFFGFDLLQTDFFKNMMLPSDSQNMSQSLTFKFPSRYIYLTLFNPNYVGSFCAMILPIAIVSLLFSKKVSIKIFSGVLSILVLINTIGCRSSAGYVGVFVSVIVLIILFRKKILKSWIPVVGFIICCAGALIFININYSGIITNEISGYLPKKQSPYVHTSGQGKYITDMAIDKNNMKIYVENIPINVKFNSKDKSLSFLDDTGKDVKIVKSPTDSSVIGIDNSKYTGLNFKISKSLIEINGANTKYYTIIDNTGSFKFVNQAGRPIDIVNPNSVGFKGMERWASSRGYIWSRTIPLLKDTIFLGHGPDTFAIYFPQNDFKGKLQYLDTPYILVDKPHNMYLQIAVNTGIFSLVAFLTFVLWYIISSLRLYIKPKKDISFYYIAGSACVTSVVGFLVSGIANDSNVNISPIFWILLGVGFACNRLYQKELLINSLDHKAVKFNNKSFKK